MDNITIIVQVKVIQEFIADFITETKKSQTATINEDGCWSYWILQDSMDETKFTLVEKYMTDEAIEFHKKTPHFLAWRENVQHMMEVPRISTRNYIVA